MQISSLNRLGQTIRPLDAVVAIDLFLLEWSHHAWTLGLLTAWIGIRCCQKVWEDHNQSDWREKIYITSSSRALSSFRQEQSSDLMTTQVHLFMY